MTVCTDRKNQSKCTQIMQNEPNFQNTKLFITAVYTMTNNKKQRTMNYQKQTQSNPIKPNFKRHNFSERAGGGIANLYCWKPTLTNCTLIGNSADFGGAMDNFECDMTVLSNCIFWGNSDIGGMDESAQFNMAWSINYCCVQGWTGAWGGIGNTINYWWSQGIQCENGYGIGAAENAEKITSITGPYGYGECQDACQP